MAVTVLPENTAEARLRVRGGKQAFTSDSSTWTRPGDWLSMPAISASDTKFVGLLAITDDDTNFLALSAAGAYTVDWGDGSATENVNSGTTAYHQYTYSSIPSSTNSTRGYRQVIVTVTPQSGQTFTSINIRIKHNQSGLSAYETKWLDVAIAGSSLTTITIGSSGESVRTRWLEQANILSSAKTSWAAQFYNCRSLQSVSVASSATVTSAANMFRTCSSLQTVPLFNTSSVTTMESMFAECVALSTVPRFNTASVTNMSYMFDGCSSLQAVPLFTTSSVTNLSAMFQFCVALKTVPLFNTALVTDMSYMFNGCSSLQAVPLFTTSSVTTMTAMFLDCNSLQSISLLTTSGLTAAPTSMFSNCSSLASGATSGIKYAVSYGSCQLSKTALESIFGNLGKASGAQTVTITSNWGAPSAISKTSSGTTLGSTTVTMSNTSSLEVGMEISGTGISDAVAVTFQDTGDTVTRTAHGIPNDTPVSFATVVTTTGISTYTTYYVVNATANTFQVSDTVGGSAKALTTDGSGTVLYGTTITAINTNVSVTLSIPASATGTVTTSSALLKRSKARLKGWTVSP